MPELTVHRRCLEKGKENCQGYLEEISALKEQVSNIRKEMRTKVRGKNKIGTRLTGICAGIGACYEDMAQIKQLLAKVEGIYKSTEQKLTEAGTAVSATLWEHDRLHERKLPSMSPICFGHAEGAGRHRIVELEGAARKEQKKYQWNKEILAGGIPAGIFLHGSLSGSEWEEGNVGTIGDCVNLGWKESQAGWLARGDAMACLGEDSFAGNVALLSWEENMEGSLAWSAQNSGKTIPKLSLEMELAAQGLSIYGEKETGKNHQELEANFAYANFNTKAAAGILEDGRPGMEQQATLEAGLVKGEARAGFELWGIICGMGIQGSVGSAGFHAGYEIAEQSFGWNLGAALGAGIGMDMEVDWSEAKLPWKKDKKQRKNKQ